MLISVEAFVACLHIDHVWWVRGNETCDVLEFEVLKNVCILEKLLFHV